MISSTIVYMKGTYRVLFLHNDATLNKNLGTLVKNKKMIFILH